MTDKTKEQIRTIELHGMKVIQRTNSTLFDVYDCEGKLVAKGQSTLLTIVRTIEATMVYAYHKFVE